MSDTGKISEAEAEVMKVLWAAQEEEGRGFYGLGTSEVVKILQAGKEWDRSTVRTLLKRLADKGAVLTEKQMSLTGRQEIFLYRPAFPQAEYRQDQTKGLIARLYGGSAKNLVAALVDEKALTKEEISELRTFFEER